MPYQQVNSYSPPGFLFNGHIETIYPVFFRKTLAPNFQRERLILRDSDHVSLDWIKKGNKKLVILNHGLEGNAQRPYMLGMANIFLSQGYDALPWNFRGCDGEMNSLPRFYHSGETEDFHEVIIRACQEYEEIVLIGFSLGGNILLKYLGEDPAKVPSNVKCAIAISVPIDLHGSCLRIMSGFNRVYEKRFLNNLGEKIRLKAVKIPGEFDVKRILKIRKLMEFDDQVTAPLHGFNDALDYYTKSSSLQFLNHIKIPALLINAQNDPMLSESCYPQNISNEYFHFENWKRGGHVGFSEKDTFYASEKRALSFAEQHLSDDSQLN